MFYAKLACFVLPIHSQYNVTLFLSIVLTFSSRISFPSIPSIMRHDRALSQRVGLGMSLISFVGLFLSRWEWCSSVSLLSLIIMLLSVCSHGLKSFGNFIRPFAMNRGAVRTVNWLIAYFTGFYLDTHRM